MRRAGLSLVALTLALAAAAAGLHLR
ncbi:MAG: hypothetical protein QOD65_3167, partial [Gaiellales bacterium]|nr:hypothetical protein [Gaiellales bacterium]